MLATFKLKRYSRSGHAVRLGGQLCGFYVVQALNLVQRCLELGHGGEHSLLRSLYGINGSLVLGLPFQEVGLQSS